MDFVAQIKDIRERKRKEELEKKERLKAEDARLDTSIQAARDKEAIKNAKAQDFIATALPDILAQVYLDNPSFSHFDILANSTSSGTTFYLMLGSPKDNGHQFIRYLDIPFSTLENVSSWCRNVKYENTDGKTIPSTEIKMPSYTVNCISSDCHRISSEAMAGVFVFRFVPIEKEKLYGRYLRRKARAFIKEMLLPEILKKAEGAQYTQKIFFSCTFWGNLKYVKIRKNKLQFEFGYAIKYDGETILRAAEMCPIYGIKAEVEKLISSRRGFIPEFIVTFTFELEADKYTDD